MRGQFITFEGGEGTGKSTHAGAAGGSPQGARHRRRAHARARRLARRRERSAMCCSRARPSRSAPKPRRSCSPRRATITCATPSSPRLARGRWVICDRFIDSTPRLSGHARPRRSEAASGRWSGSPSATSSPISPSSSTCRPRSGSRAPSKRRGEGEADRFEAEALEFHESCARPFATLALSEPERCVLIDATEPRPAVADRIWKVVNDRLDPATAPVALESIAS